MGNNSKAKIKREGFSPGVHAFVVGVRGVMRRFDVGEHRARNLLREWWTAMQTGAVAPRVFREATGRGAWMYFTTDAELYAHAPRMRDQALMRKVERLEEQLDAEKRRVDKLTAEVSVIARRLQR